MSAHRLEKAVFQDLETGDSVAVQFNPADYQVEKQVSWKEQAVAGRDGPRVEFTTGGRRKLGMTLCFDSTDDGSDVRAATSHVERLALISGSTSPPRPPRVLFRWGGFEFRGVIEGCVSRYLLFGEDGLPLRAELRVSLGEYFEEAASPAGAAGAPAAAPATVAPLPGERIDQVADRACGDPGAWTALAEANGIEDPLELPDGAALEVPSAGARR